MHLVLIFVIAFIDSTILKTKIKDYRILRFWTRGVAVPVGILSLAMVTAWSVSGAWRDSFFGVLGIGVISAAVILALGWLLAIDKDTRTIIRNKILIKFKRV